MSDWVPEYIEMLQIENGSSYQIQMTITFYLDVRLSPVIYRDAPNWKRKLLWNSKDNNFLLECPIVSRNITRRSKLKTEDPSKFKRQ